MKPRRGPHRHTRRSTRKTRPAYSSRGSSVASSMLSYASYTRSESSIGTNRNARESRSYQRIKVGLKKSVPAAILLWAFHKMPSRTGLTSRRIITFLKKHYEVTNNNQRRPGKSIGAILRCAVDFGLLEKRGTKFFLANKKNKNR